MPCRALPGGGRLFVAGGYRDRLTGLMGLASLPHHTALLIPGVDSVHTAWMRFALDVAFLDSRGVCLRVVEGLRPYRVAGCRGARSVVEMNAGEAALFGYVEPSGGAAPMDGASSSDGAGPSPAGPSAAAPPAATARSRSAASPPASARASPGRPVCRS